MYTSHTWVYLRVYNSGGYLSPGYTSGCITVVYTPPCYPGVPVVYTPPYCPGVHREVYLCADCSPPHVCYSRFTVGREFSPPCVIPVSLLGRKARSCLSALSRFTVGQELHTVNTRFTVGAPSHLLAACFPSVLNIPDSCDVRKYRRTES